MSEENKPVEVAAENKNAAAEQDVQNVLAELEGREASEETEKSATPATEEKKETEAANGEKPAGEEQKEDDADAEAKEEARIIAAAQKLGEEALTKEGSRDQQNGRGRGGKRVNYRDNIKSDFSTLEETSDPFEIRKQVRTSCPLREMAVSYHMVLG